MYRQCYSNKNEVKKFFVANNIDLGDVPEELKGLTEIEKILISQTFPIDVGEFVSRLSRHSSMLDTLVVCRQSAEGSMSFKDFNNDETDDMIIQNFIPAPIPSRNENCIIDDVLTRMQSESGSVMWLNIGGTAINEFNTSGYIARTFQLCTQQPSFFEKQVQGIYENVLIPKWGWRITDDSMKNNEDEMSRILTHFNSLITTINPNPDALIWFLKDKVEYSFIYENDRGQPELITLRNDPYVNPHNQLQLQGWYANVDLKPVLTICAALQYVTKYATKSELWSSFLEILNNILSNSDPYDPSLGSFQHLLLYTIVEHNFSAQETCHLLLSFQQLTENDALSWLELLIVIFVKKKEEIKDLFSVSVNNLEVELDDYKEQQEAEECSEDIRPDWMILAKWFCGVRHRYTDIDSIDLNTLLKIETHYNAIIANHNQVDPLRVIIMGIAETGKSYIITQFEDVFKRYL
ncbi:uncharacterized protein LOC113214878 [Rhizophagus clarus]|uniref:Uncharacterized protein LOC113214878 n=1 Tax=Rhizophagus clarus TaxID=94130 RepID=A0A8H3ME57_9GLOM|nr:uncharacterized protein LOC113214878 [Rhizophagus clarus]